jgi:uncharacterized protein (TIGR00290 family)
MERILLSWSGGKDSALALEALRASGAWEVASLLTTVARSTQRISMHGVSRALLERQARALGLPLEVIELPTPCPGEEYAECMSNALLAWRERGVRHVACGDLFLADLRAWREHNLATIGMKGVFPLWGRDTRALTSDFVARGYRAILCCVDTRKLPADFAGRALDRALLDELPAGVDPAGENGEYHSFVHGGPLFASDLRIELGERVERDGFAWRELLEAR